MKAELMKSPRAGKKYRVVFTDSDGKKTHTDFGAAGMGDFTIYYKQSPAIGEEKKRLYLKRHQVREKWEQYKTAGSLSRWILWNLPTVEASFADYKRRFGLS